MGRYYIDKYTGKLEKTDMYLVRLIKKDGSIIEDLEPRRLVPLTNHNMYITLLDSEEKEIGFVRDIAELDEESVKALDECFSEYYMIPKIQSVVSVEDKFGTLKWTVDTNHGRVIFGIRNRHNDIKKLHPTNRVIIRDANDNRYEIQDVSKLDAHSAHLIFSYL